MYNKLKIYQIYTPLPFVMLLLGAVFFRQAIVNTLASNPHPQINYSIFALILIGAGFILFNLRKLMNEARVLSGFSEAVRRGSEPAQLQKMAIDSDADVAYVLRLIAASSGRTMSQREQAALEKELVKADIRLNNRHTLPQHITNLLVGMGLLGTFIGLLATLADIAALISSFATLDMKAADPVEVFRTLVERMRAPMYSMGIAFSASLYGLLGSIILGFMMVSIRRCMQDLVSFLGSEVAQHVEFSLAREQSGIAAGLSTAGGQVAAGAEARLVGEDVRVLRRIEERLAESTRMQEALLRGEREEFARQRGEFIRSLSEHGSSVGQFNVELQRIAAQLGAVLNSLERGGVELRAQLHDDLSSLIRNAGDQARDSAATGDLMVRLADDSAEARRLLLQIHERLATTDPQVIGSELARVLRLAIQDGLASGKSGAGQGAG